ncbi:Uncharacterised protein [Chryseobacterium nakagawai]|uniref:Uncharacterized protein n=1 Tax=Chryseobacterium nakagawai TaxID=1241982 RepID=A0AAD0YLS5_CHRNA|nr:hypothetical protein [Chryseobacterium nakagawai]AZA91152.1 hypothetical protein EG343_11175 [Chryseobacterium nakagawai]VEH22712.1 Uncharacterised protein [Chryseobacterium nakagawai]
MSNFNFERNKDFLKAVEIIAIKHNVYLSEILTVAEKIEKKDRMDYDDFHQLHKVIGIPFGFYVPQNEIVEGLVTNEKFLSTIIEISKNDYSFAKLK